ncbi:MAG TPA: FHA domain-containing protein [Solirubrobacteraceae bacterium]|jgi:predicted component of type VI protein secretion system|nr:FHA domain-containing protein [Solirubrobacteraceae bacterium]
MGRLRVTNGPLAGHTISVAEEIVIGRENVDLVIDDAEISRRHTAVRPLPGALEVEDLGSSNGTFVDGERIDAPTRVGGGAEIRLGTTVLAVEGVLPVDRTRVRDIPDAKPSGPLDPQVTRLAGQQPAIADPQVTRARNVPADLAQATRASEVPAATDASQQPDDYTRARPVPDAAPAASATAQPSPPSAAVGAFSPPTRRRKRGLASRSWVPAVLSFSTVVLVAIALVIYFAVR